MEYEGPERRREPRFPIETEAVLESTQTGEKLAGTTRNISVGGVLVQVEQNPGLSVGDEVRCEIKLPPQTEEPLPSWGIGNVVRVEDSTAAIQLAAAVLASPTKPDEAD
jgi:PilZ domain